MKIIFTILFCMLCSVCCAGIYTSFPDSDLRSGKFLVIEKGVGTLQNIIRVELDIDKTSTFWLTIFDGDNSVIGAWDWKEISSTTSCTYTLYPDPQRLGYPFLSRTTWWSSVYMYDNTWWASKVFNDSRALGSDNRYHYILEVTWDSVSSHFERNCFKVGVEGQVYIRANQVFSILGYSNNLFPLGITSPIIPSETYFDGCYTFNILISKGTKILDVWDGDLDYGANNYNYLPIIPYLDTNDFNSPILPDWYVGYAASEGANIAEPPDPSIFYIITNPKDTWKVINKNPSAHNEWELFRLALHNEIHAPRPYRMGEFYKGISSPPDFWVPNMDSGGYILKVIDPATIIRGLLPWSYQGCALQNTLYFRISGDVYIKGESIKL